MNKLIFLIFIFFCLSFSTQNHEKKRDQIVNSTSVPNNTKGKLLCYEKHKKCGKVKIGKRIECTFLFKNIGYEAVSIVDYQASCNCTEVRFDKKDVNPGDSLKVALVIDTKGKYIGSHSSTVIIKTNGERTFYDIRADFETE